MTTEPNERFNDFMDNHWVHMVAKVARLEGMMYILCGIGLAMVGLLAKIAWAA